MHDWKDAQYLISKFKTLNRKHANLRIYVEQLYSPRITKRRNEAMLMRRTLIRNKEIISGYVDYPAILMVKKENRSKYEKQSSY